MNQQIKHPLLASPASIGALELKIEWLWLQWAQTLHQKMVTPLIN